MIEAVHISKSFVNKDVLKDISLKMEQGKTNLIIGQSGCGKSVFLKCMVGLEQPDTGKVIYDGRVFSEMDFEEKKLVRQEIGMLFQGSALFDSMTVEENVRFPLKMFTKKTDEEIMDRVNFCLSKVQLTNVNKLYPSEISGGMKKRVGIARAISLNPKYLFCDEPNSGLDPQTSIVIDDLIKDITVEFNTTTVIVTHDMNSVMNIGDKINFFYTGQLWWQGNSDEIILTDNKELNDFVFASSFMKKYKEAMVKA